MAFGDNLNFRAPQADGTPRLDARNAEASLEQLSEAVDQVRNHLIRTQRRIDRSEQHYASLVRSVRLLWVLIAVTLVGFGAVLWYGLSATTGQRALSTDDSAIRGFLDNDRKDAGAAQPVPVPVPAQAPDNPHSVPDLAKVNPAASAPVQANVEKVKPQTEAAVHPASAIPADHVDRQRKDFRLSSNQTEQVAPGIYLTIKGVDIGNKQVNGWLQIARDGRIVWIRNQEAERALSFVSQAADHPSYLIFTRLDSSGVSGYVMIPG